MSTTPSEHDDRKEEINADPISGQPGAHPVGTGVGAAGAGATGVAIGTVLGGPVGGVVGAIAGAVAGGYAGKAVAESIDPTVEDAHWRDEHARQPYATADDDYENDFAPAYRTGYAGYADRGGENPDFAQAESDLQREYERERGASRLDWERARPAARAAWERVHGRRLGGGTPVEGPASL